MLGTFPNWQRGLIFGQSTVLQSLIKVLFSFLKMRGHPDLTHRPPGKRLIISNILSLHYNFRLEDCVRDLLSAANSAVGDRKFATPMEAVTYLADTSHFDKTGCYDPEPDDIARLLRHVVRNILRPPLSKKSFPVGRVGKKTARFFFFPDFIFIN